MLVAKGTGSKTVHLNNWAFAQIRQSGSDKKIVALLGKVKDKFYPGSSHIVQLVAVEGLSAVAISQNGTNYVLGEVDPEFALLCGNEPLAALKRAITINLP